MTLYLKGSAWKCVVNRAVQGTRVADFPDGLQRGSQVRAIVPQNGRMHTNLRQARGRRTIRA